MPQPQQWSGDRLVEVRVRRPGSLPAARRAGRPDSAQVDGAGPDGAQPVAGGRARSSARPTAPRRPARARSAPPAQPSSWFDHRGRPRTTRRSGRVLLVAVIAVAAGLAFGAFVLAADVSNHTVLSDGQLEHRGSLGAPVWIPPVDLSWDTPPPSPTPNDARPEDRPAPVDPPTVPGQPAPRTPTTPTSPTGSRPMPDTTILSPDVAAAVAQLNDTRAGADCGPLRVDVRLVGSARDHAEELAAGTGDTGAAARMIEAGYPSPGGENVATGQPSLADATAQLLASASHRANIVDCTFTTVGLADAAGVQGDFWVQDFGR